MARHFFLNPSQVSVDNNKKRVVFSEMDARHLHTLRKNSGDIVTGVIRNDQINETITLLIKLTNVKKVYIGEVIEEKVIYTNKQQMIHILQCIAKGDKMDYIIQKSSELGADTLTPLTSINTVVSLDFGQKKLTRWQTISHESSIQSGRLDTLVIHPPQTLESYCKANIENLNSPASLNILLSEFEKNTTLKNLREKILNPTIKNIFILTGSEGGFTKDEIQDTQRTYHFHPITIGTRILRAETAPLYILSAIDVIKLLG